MQKKADRFKENVCKEFKKQTNKQTTEKMLTVDSEV